MAEYYPLLAKAAANLKEPSAEARRALYERARKALLAQLKNAQPPVPDADIAREEAALDAAATRVETEIAAHLAQGAPLTAPMPAQAPSPVSPAEKGDVSLSPPAAPSRFNSPPALRPPPPLRAPPSVRPSAARPSAPPPAVNQTPLSLDKAAVARTPPPFGAWPEPSTAAPTIDAPTTETNATAGIEPSPLSSQDDPAGGDFLRNFGRSRVEASVADNASADVERREIQTRPEAVRPLAPVSRDASGGVNKSVLFGALIALLAMVAIGGYAYSTRDKPEDFAPPTAAPSAEVDPGANKIAGRAAPAKDTGGDAVQGKTAAAAPSPAGVPVAQRAALLIEAPDEPSKVKTLVGTVVWSIETASNGLPGLRAKASIPGANFNLDIFIVKNIDPKIASTHRIELRFAVGANDNGVSGVKQIAAPEMRLEDHPSGDALNGVTAQVTDSYFWFALAQGDTAVERNIDLLRSRGWLDVPILLTTNKIAKITLEKGAVGDQLIRQIIDAWAQQQ